MLCIYENLNNVKMPFGGPSELESLALTGALSEATLKDELCVAILVRQQAGALCNTIPQHNPSNPHEDLPYQTVQTETRSFTLRLGITLYCQQMPFKDRWFFFQHLFLLLLFHLNLNLHLVKTRSCSNLTSQTRVFVAHKSCGAPAIARLYLFFFFKVWLWHCSQSYQSRSRLSLIYLSLHQSNGSPKLKAASHFSTAPQPGLCPFHAPLPPPVQREGPVTSSPGGSSKGSSNGSSSKASSQSSSSIAALRK